MVKESYSYPLLGPKSVLTEEAEGKNKIRN